MIPLSPAAEKQLNALTQYYAERRRDAAIDNLVDCLERASARYLDGRGLFYDAPRPYPTLTSISLALDERRPLLDCLQPGEGRSCHPRDLLRSGEHPCMAVNRDTGQPRTETLEEHSSIA